MVRLMYKTDLKVLALKYTVLEKGFSYDLIFLQN